MLVLALDTATPTVVVGIIEVAAEVDKPVEPGWHALCTRAQRSLSSGNRHAEMLGQLIPEVLAEAGVGMRELSAIVVGIGPGPFTGLRVGMMTAAALADALGRPVHGVCTHDAVAAMHAALAGSPPYGPAAQQGAAVPYRSGMQQESAPEHEVVVDRPTVPDEGFVVVTDARRRECYWARYAASGVRVSGPHVHRPADVLTRADWRPGGLVIGDPAFSDVLGTEILPASPVPTGLVLAVDDSLTDLSSRPLEPLYLRRPDATPPAARKLVTPR